MRHDRRRGDVRGCMDGGIRISSDHRAKDQIIWMLLTKKSTFRTTRAANSTYFVRAPRHYADHPIAKPAIYLRRMMPQSCGDCVKKIGEIDVLASNVANRNP